MTARDRKQFLRSNPVSERIETPVRTLTDIAVDLARNDWRWPFLEHLAKTACVSAACMHVRKSRDVAYRHRKQFPIFRAKWDEALEIACEALEYEARARAFDRTDPASAALLMFLLRAHRPERYRDKQAIAKRDDDVDLTTLTDEQLQAIVNG